MHTNQTTALDLAGRYQRHPIQALLLTAGVGYLLGGGLFTTLTLRALQVGVRIGALPLVRRELFRVAEVALSAREHRAK